MSGAERRRAGATTYAACSWTTRRTSRPSRPAATIASQLRTAARTTRRDPGSSSGSSSRVRQYPAARTAAVVSVSLLMPYLMSEIMHAHGWPGYSTVIVLASALALRSRAFYGVAQRGALAAAGTIGYVMVLDRFSHSADATTRVGLLAGLLVLLGAMVMAAVRPWPRRLLPIWEFLATMFDVVTGLALIPLVLEILGAYRWARGLFG